MTSTIWPTKARSVANLHLDDRNPRLGREFSARAPQQVIQYLFEHDKAMDVAESIATRGYFPNEPLLAIKEDDRLVVVEGNRRLAALKALLEPGILEDSYHRKISRLSRRIDRSQITEVPVTIAPNRRATDRQVSGRHVGTPVLAWRAENRASFILDKIAEGYDNDDLRDELGFNPTDIQHARQTRAIAEMARSLDLPDEIKAKLDNPRAKVFSTIERVIDSKVGRDYLMISPDPEHGLKGNTSKKEFVKGFSKLVSDIVLKKVSSRSLNKSEDIENYFKTSWAPNELPIKQKGSFVPSDITKDKPSAAPSKHTTTAKAKKTKSALTTVLPKDLRIRYGNERLVDIRSELVKLRRVDYPNAGAVLLRVFLELSIIDYLKRTKKLDPLIARLEKKDSRPLMYGVPNMKQLVPEITDIAKKKLTHHEANSVEKALKYNAAAPFTLSDMHSFVHQAGELPNDRDILQFWMRLEPLFRLMLEQDDDTESKS